MTNAQARGLADWRALFEQYGAVHGAPSRGNRPGDGAVAAIAREQGLGRQVIYNALHRLRKAGMEPEWAGAEAPADDPGFVTPELPSPEMPVDELIRRLCSDYERTREADDARKLVTVDVTLDGPIGLFVFGDPHLDSRLTNWPKLLRDVELVRTTPGLFAVNLGDSADNWSGKLAEQYAHSRTTRGEAFRLVEWFMNSLPWMLWLYGNHDLWAQGGDLQGFMAKQTGTLTAEWSQRVALRFPNGFEYRINHKHGFNGSSMWHPTHGQLKTMRFGARDHLYTGGHTHQTGLIGPQLDANTGEWMWGLQVGAYKDISDAYGKRCGESNNAAPSALVVIDPDRDPAGRTHVFFDVEKGARFLTLLRADHDARLAA